MDDQDIDEQKKRIRVNLIGHIQGHSDFEYWIESTCHYESIWSLLKSEIKSIYYIYPLEDSKNLTQIGQKFYKGEGPLKNERF